MAKENKSNIIIYQSEERADTHRSADGRRYRMAIPTANGRPLPDISNKCGRTY